MELLITLMIVWIIQIPISILLIYIYNRIYFKLNGNKKYWKEEDEAACWIFNFIFIPILTYKIIYLLNIKKYRNRQIDKIDFEMIIDDRPGQNLFWFNHQYILTTKCKHFKFKIGSKDCEKCKYYIKTNDIQARFNKGIYEKEILNVECCFNGKLKQTKNSNL